MPIRHLTVTGIPTARFMASTHSGDQRRLRHQAGAETAVLHPVRRTADIEIDLVIAELLADFRRDGEIARIRAAKLQRHRMLAGIETEQPLPIAMNDGAGRQHLRIKPGTPRHQTVEHPAMPVGPVHHRGNGKAPVIDFVHFLRIYGHF